MKFLEKGLNWPVKLSKAKKEKLGLCVQLKLQKDLLLIKLSWKLSELRWKTVDLKNIFENGYFGVKKL